MITESQLMAGVLATVEEMEIGKKYYLSPDLLQRYNDERAKNKWNLIPSPEFIVQ